MITARFYQLLLQLKICIPLSFQILKPLSYLLIFWNCWMVTQRKQAGQSTRQLISFSVVYYDQRATPWASSQLPSQVHLEEVSPWLDVKLRGCCTKENHLASEIWLVGMQLLSWNHLDAQVCRSNGRNIAPEACQSQTTRFGYPPSMFDEPARTTDRKISETNTWCFAEYTEPG